MIKAAVIRESVPPLVLGLLLSGSLLGLLSGCGSTDKPKTPKAVYDALQEHLMAGRWDRGFDYLSARSQSQLASAVEFMVGQRLIDTEGRVPSARWVLIHPQKAVQIVAPLSGDFDGAYITPDYRLLEHKQVKGQTLLRYQYSDATGGLRQRWVRFVVEEGVWRVDIDFTDPGDVVESMADEGAADS